VTAEEDLEFWLWKAALSDGKLTVYRDLLNRYSENSLWLTHVLSWSNSRDLVAAGALRHEVNAAGEHHVYLTDRGHAFSAELNARR